MALELTAIGAVLFFFGRQQYRIYRNGEWHPYVGRMRRYIGGQWQYREMTQKEAAEDTSNWVV